MKKRDEGRIKSPSNLLEVYKAIREQEGVTLSELGDILNVSTSLLYKFERGGINTGNILAWYFYHATEPQRFMIYCENMREVGYHGGQVILL